MKMVLDPSANEEMRDAAFFYEDCRDGLGREFLDAVELAFCEIARRFGAYLRGDSAAT